MSEVKDRHPVSDGGVVEGVLPRQGSEPGLGRARKPGYSRVVEDPKETRKFVNFDII